MKNINFNSLGQFALHLNSLVFKEYIALQDGLNKACEIIEKDAKKEIGHLQPQAGPFNEWDELADSTKAEKKRLGYKFNKDYNPLLRTGRLRDSISHKVERLEGQVGSTSPIMVYQELGTVSIPPRSVLGMSAYKNAEKVKALIGIAAVTGIMGGEIIYAAEFLNYAFDKVENS